MSNPGNEPKLDLFIFETHELILQFENITFLSHSTADLFLLYT